MKLSKALESIPHDLVIAKVTVFGNGNNMQCYIYYSYWKNTREYVSVDSVKRSFIEIIPEVNRDQLIRPILYSIFLNDF